jgi:hypothetical protein
MENSTSRSGMDQRRRKQTQATRNAPPPFSAAMRGNLHMFPVPTAIPNMASIIPQRELKVCFVTLPVKDCLR